MSGWAKRLGFCAAIAFLYLYPFPYFAGIRSANELPRVYLTQAIAEQGTFAIDEGVERWGKTADMSPHQGRTYSNKAPGSSMLAVPAYLLLKLFDRDPSLASITWTCRIATGVLPTLIFLFFFTRFLRRFAVEGHDGHVAVAAYALGSMAMTYSLLFISHQLAAISIFSSYMLTVKAAEDDAHDVSLAAAGFAAGLALLVDYQAAFAGVPVAAYMVFHCVRLRRWRGLAVAVVAAAVPIAVLLIYHNSAFGSPWRTGYAASETFAQFHQRGLLGMDRLRWQALWGSTFAPDNGLFIFSPFLLLAVPGTVVMWREPRMRAHAAICAAVVAIYLLFISAIVFWRGGWQVGPRYITAMLPFAMVPTAVALSRARRLWVMRGIALAGVFVGIVVYCSAAVVFPHFPDKFSNPLYEVTFQLLGDHKVAYNALWLVGAKGLATIVPFVAVCAIVLVYIAAPARKNWKAAALAAGLAATILVGYSRFPRSDAAGDKAYEFVRGTMPK